MRFLLCGMLFLCLLLGIQCVAQDSTNNKAQLTDRVLDFSGRWLNKLKGKTDQMQSQLVSQSAKYLQQMAKREARLKAKLYRIDSAKAATLFSGSNATYQALIAKLQATPTGTGGLSAGMYSGSLDTLHTSLSFLQNNPSLLSSAKDIGALDQSMVSVQQLQARLGQTAEIQQFVAQREQLLKTQLAQYGFGKALAGFNQQAYYYQQQLQQYKEMLHDKDRLKQKALEELSQLPAYQSFIAKNSYVSRLFGLPAGYGSESAAFGLQTKAMVQQAIGQSGSGGLGSSSSGSSQDGSPSYEQQQLASAQQSLSQLQDKVSKLGLPGASQGALTMPDFQPNTQRTKTFWRRLEFGSQLQVQKTSILLPTTANVGVKLGYKFSDRAVVGIGASYLLGMRNSSNKFSLSNQGAALQSYIDVKLKGSIWFSGGIEGNYIQAFSGLDQLRKLDAWQQSALVGVTKKYKISSKYQGNLQLLFDMLYRQHVPASQPILFRTGISF